jgi:oligopeptide/dipeptide ABC transporter ATP-binding protein
VNGKLQFSQPKNERALIIISHDVKVMAELADTLIVMYAGRVVESGDCSILLGNGARHPYTQMMKSIAILTVYKSEMTQTTLADLGTVPTMLNLPTGCKFHPRCTKRIGKCETEEPLLEELTTNPAVSLPRSDARSSLRSRFAGCRPVPTKTGESGDSDGIPDEEVGGIPSEHPEHREESRNGILAEKALATPHKVRCYVATE